MKKIVTLLILIIGLFQYGCSDNRTTCQKLIDQRIHVSDMYTNYRQEESKYEAQRLDTLIYKCGCDSLR